MNYALSILMLLLCAYSIRSFLIKPDGGRIMLAVIGLFSIGYYVLPVFMGSASGLNLIDENSVSMALLMSIVFFFSLIMGFKISDYKNFFPIKISRLSLSVLDRFFTRNYKRSYFIAFGFWLYYFFTSDLTVYMVEDVDSYINNHSKFSGLISVIANISMAIMAISISIATKDRSRVRVLMLLCYLSLVLLLLSTAQRLYVMTPIFMLVVSFMLYGNKKLALKYVYIAVFFLVSISPLMVFLREFQISPDKGKILIVLEDYKSSNFVEAGLKSLAQRADLLQVMTELKDSIDSGDISMNTSQYLLSVVTAYIPRFIFPNKPYPLSDDGSINGELSVKAWSLRKGNDYTGSLSAFGSIAAYREGWWPWVIMNGFLTGILLNYMYSLLGRGGHISKILFVSLFVTLCVKTSPPSFFYILVYISSTMQIAVALTILNYYLKKIRHGVT